MKRKKLSRGHKTGSLSLEKALAQLDCWLSPLSFHLTADQRSQFRTYLELLLTWNKRFNLISERDEVRVIERHFVESAAVLMATDFPNNCAVLDLGTGGGFPGLPMKLLRPDLRMTLLDSKRRKVLFLQEVARGLRLPNLEIVCARAEEAAQDVCYFEKFDVVVSRAVAKLPQLAEWAMPFLREEGRLLAIKGGELGKELTSKDMEPFKIKLVEFPRGTLAFREGRKIVIVERQKHPAV